MMNGLSAVIVFKMGRLSSPWVDSCCKQMIYQISNGEMDLAQRKRRRDVVQ